MIGTLLGNEFEILELLGAGGMGQVYVAKQRSAGNRRVALKVLKPDLQGASGWKGLVSRFEGEILSLSQLHHPNIVTLYTSGVDEATQTLYMAMELLDGETLESRLKRSRLSPPEFFPYADAILDGLDAAHGRDIVHRDLKPGNLMTTKHGRQTVVKILDFGIAKILREESTQLTIGPSPATLLYSSPEHFKDSSEIGPASDLFCLGIVFYRMISGLLPFRGKTHHELTHQILYEAPQPLAHEVPAIEELIVRMMSKEKAKRPELAEVRNELLRIARFVGESATWEADAEPADSERTIPMGSADLPDAGVPASLDEAEATIPVGREPTEPAPPARREPRSRKPLFMSAGVVAIAALAFVIYRLGPGDPHARSGLVAADSIAAGEAAPAPIVIAEGGVDTSASPRATNPGTEGAAAAESLSSAPPSGSGDGADPAERVTKPARTQPSSETAKRAAEAALQMANDERRKLEGLDRETGVPRIYFNALWQEASRKHSDAHIARERKEYARAGKLYQGAGDTYRRIHELSRALYDNAVPGARSADDAARLAALEAMIGDNPIIASFPPIGSLRESLRSRAGETR